MKQLTILWNFVEEKTSRETPYKLERHAFFVAAYHNGYTPTEISKATGFNHAMVYHARKWHEENLKEPYYRNKYNFYLRYNNLPKNLENLEKEIVGLLRKRRKFKKQLSEFNNL